MTFTTDIRVSIADVSKQALLSRFLIGLILNPQADVNQPDGRAFRAFATGCLGIGQPPSMDTVAMAIDLSDRRCGLEGDETSLDLVISFGQSLWAIDALYAETPDAEKMWWRTETLRTLAGHLGYQQANVLFIMPEEIVLKVVQEKLPARYCLIELIRMNDPAVRIVTWEMILAILVGSGLSAAEVDVFCRARHSGCDVQLGRVPLIPDSETWCQLILGSADPVFRNSGQVAAASLPARDAEQ